VGAAGYAVLKRAAVGGSLALLIIAAAVVVSDRSDAPRSEAPSASPNRNQQLILYAADASGFILTRGSVMIGMTSGGEVRWKLPLGRDDLLPFAVCLKTCPEAEVTMGRSGSNPPDRPDGPRLRIAGPAWRPERQRPRLGIDRPLFPGPRPARIVSTPTGASVVSLRGTAVDLPGTDVISALAADRASAVLVAPRGGQAQRGLLFRHGADGWRLASIFPLTQGAGSACLSPDGARMAIVGGGPPLTIDLTTPREAPRKIPTWRPLERSAGLCALGADRIATAIIRSTLTANETILTIHSRAGRRSSLRLTGSLPTGLWISARTGTTALLQNGAVVLVSRAGRRSTWSGIQAATPQGGSRLRVVSATGRFTVRSF
jgi:hypothetical protein